MNPKLILTGLLVFGEGAVGVAMVIGGVMLAKAGHPWLALLPLLGCVLVGNTMGQALINLKQQGD